MRSPPPNADPDHPSVDLLLWAYRNGAFPMADPADEGDGIGWYSADPRAILPLDSFHVPKSLARVVRSGRFTVRSDTVFEQVVRSCACDRSQHNRSWINEEIIRAYTDLHHAGHAHSVEAYLLRDGGASAEQSLVGGLYGVHIGSAFFGESMFSLPALGGTNASKVCLVHLMTRLRGARFTLVDAQFHNPHLEQFGLKEIPLAEYLKRLKQAINDDRRWPF